MAAPGGARLELAGSEMELVAAIAGRGLKIYLDRLATNEPIDGAAIVVTVDGIAAGTAKAVGSGTYVLPAPWADEPGIKALKFAIVAGSDGGDARRAGSRSQARRMPSNRRRFPGKRYCRSRTLGCWLASLQESGSSFRWPSVRVVLPVAQAR